VESAAKDATNGATRDAEAAKRRPLAAAPLAPGPLAQSSWNVVGQNPTWLPGVKPKTGEQTMLKNIFVIGAIVLLSATSAMAQQRGVVRDCAADVRAACGGVQPGDGRIRACLNSHLKDLTPPCQAILVRAARVGKACRGEVRTICADVKPGDRRIEACIQSHLTDFSAPCKDVMVRAAAGKS